jgi:hypothetical protein
MIFCFVANTSKCGTALICMSTATVIGRNQVVQLILEETPACFNAICDESSDERKVVQQRQKTSHIFSHKFFHGLIEILELLSRVVSKQNTCLNLV